MSIESTLESILGPQTDPVAAGYHLREIAAQDADTAVLSLQYLAEHPDQLQRSDPAVIGTLLSIIHTALLKDRDEASQLRIKSLPPELIDQVDEQLPDSVSNRQLLLQLLTISRSDQALQTLIEILQQRPPKDWLETGQILGLLMQHDDWSVDAIFPKALESISEPSLAATLLDLANYVTREERTEQHPATNMVSGLTHLLGQVVHHLGVFEENPRSFGDDIPSIQSRLSESVALAVSLCDALALIGDEQAIGKLNQAMELLHRRVQCEAAGALARLDQTAGKERLIELANDPAARLRAIQYADELGFGDEIDEELRSEDSTATAEMALWLSQPHQLGVPPTGLEVVAKRRLMWPSFESPVDVTLVRFDYNMGPDKTYSNVGLTGPATFCLNCDLADMPEDDIFAIYAGWHVEHPDIFTVAAESLNDAQRRAMETLQQHLQHLGYDSIQPKQLGLFLGEHAGIFTATREETECVVITDGLETIDQATSGRARPIGPEEIFYLYNGRKMLRTFNA